MGDVALVYRMMPESPETDVQTIASAISGILPENAKLEKQAVKPFAFGLKAIEVVIVGPDSGGLPDTVEENLGKMEGIQSVELLEMSLI